MTRSHDPKCTHPFRTGGVMEVARGGGVCSICGTVMGDIKRWQDRVVGSVAGDAVEPTKALEAAVSEIADLRTAVAVQTEALKAALEALGWSGTTDDRRKAIDLASEAVLKYGRVGNAA
jgi:hypothetical protein